MIPEKLFCHRRAQGELAVSVSPEPSLLRRLLEYNPDTGVLTWKPRGPDLCKAKNTRTSFNVCHAGAPAGCNTHTQGYALISIKGRLYRAHRLAWAMHYDSWPEGDIDHINGNRQDNRLENLRDVPRSLNQRNAKLRSNNKSGAAGVAWRANRWEAWIYAAPGQRKHIGRFKTFEEAATARKQAELESGYHKNHGRKE